MQSNHQIDIETLKSKPLFELADLVEDIQSLTRYTSETELQELENNGILRRLVENVIDNHNKKYFATGSRVAIENDNDNEYINLNDLWEGIIWDLIRYALIEIAHVPNKIIEDNKGNILNHLVNIISSEEEYLNDYIINMVDAIVIITDTCVNDFADDREACIGNFVIGLQKNAGIVINDNVAEDILKSFSSKNKLLSKKNYLQRFATSLPKKVNPQILHNVDNDQNDNNVDGGIDITRKPQPHQDVRFDLRSKKNVQRIKKIYAFFNKKKLYDLDGETAEYETYLSAVEKKIEKNTHRLHQSEKNLKETHDRLQIIKENLLDYIHFLKVAHEDRCIDQKGGVDQKRELGQELNMDDFYEYKKTISEKVSDDELLKQINKYQEIYDKIVMIQTRWNFLRYTEGAFNVCDKDRISYVAEKNKNAVIVDDIRNKKFINDEINNILGYKIPGVHLNLNPLLTVENESKNNESRSKANQIAEIDKNTWLDVKAIIIPVDIEIPDNSSLAQQVRPAAVLREHDAIHKTAKSSFYMHDDLMKTLKKEDEKDRKYGEGLNCFKSIPGKTALEWVKKNIHDQHTLITQDCDRYVFNFQSNCPPSLVEAAVLYCRAFDIEYVFTRPSIAKDFNIAKIGEGEVELFRQTWELEYRDELTPKTDQKIGQDIEKLNKLRNDYQSDLDKKHGKVSKKLKEKLRIAIPTLLHSTNGKMKNLF